MNFVNSILVFLAAWGVSSSALSLSDVQKNLGRYEGQTEFFTPFRYNPMERGRGGGLTPFAMAAAPKADSGTSARAIQDADVFKIGKPGSKLLFLLNNYRGLQIVSFEKGAEEPTRLGRVAATGNYPSDMYYNEAQDQIVVLERVYFDHSGNYYSENQSRLVIYDVKDPKNPSILKTVEIKGVIAESRKVGDILYVASRIDPDWRNHSDSQGSTGLVTSYSLKATQPKLIEQFEFTAGVNSAENMGIIEVPVGKDLFRYYLTAVTSERQYVYDGRPQRYVELVDITDPRGHISPVMRVSPRGEIQKRSQMVIKNDTLIVVSNYTRDGKWASRDNPARLAVETFLMPTKESKVIDVATATYRKEWLKYETSKLSPLSEKQRELKIAELKSHPENGLQGLFVELNKSTGVREKVEPDFSITTGDTNGQSVALQDVRVDGNFLYAFWVPANQVDPLEVYDISQPQEGIKHVAHQEIDGFVQRASPLTFKGKKYILGMGQITPQDNNETQSRSFQVVLFPIKDNGRVDRNGLKQITLREEAGYSNLGTSDKFLEVRFSGDGVGQILFSQNTQVNGVWTSGGKIVNFDLNKLSTEEDDNSVFSEGPFLEGNGSYLKRIFTNTEIGRINSFSDKALATYQEMDSSKQDAFVKAAHVLELARNIRAYFTLGSAAQRQGVQVISSTHSWLSSGESKTEFRLVPIHQPDQEEYKEMNRLTLDGTYSSHSILPHERVLLVTNDRDYNYNESKSIQTQRMYLLSLENGQLKVLGAPKVSVTEGYRGALFSFEVPFAPRNYYGFGNSLVSLGDGTFLSSSESQVNRIFVAGNQLQFESYDVEGCSVKDTGKQVEGSVVIILNNKPYWTYSEVMKLEPESLAVKKAYLAPMTLQDGKAVCGTAVNIPGSAISLQGAQLVTQDRWMEDTVSYERPDYQDPKKTVTEYEFVMETGLTSVAFSPAQAELKDVLKTASVSDFEYNKLSPLQDGSFVTVQSPVSASNRYYSDTQDYPGIYKFQFLRLDNFKFRQTVRALRMSTSQNVTLEKVLENPKQAGEYFAVLKSGGQVRVATWSLSTLRPALVKLQYEGEVDEAFVVNGFSWWSRSSQDTHFSLETRTLEFSLGLAGIKQLQLK